MVGMTRWHEMNRGPGGEGVGYRTDWGSGKNGLRRDGINDMIWERSRSISSSSSSSIYYNQSLFRRNGQSIVSSF